MAKPEELRIFKTKSFSRLADKEGITTAELITAAGEVSRGEYEADLGGGVFKKRIARAGGGKAGGYRVILFFRKNERLFFAYMFAKSDRANISQREKRDYKDAAGLYLDVYTDEELNAKIKAGSIEEIGQ
ncbi:addiction module toxin RelE [Spirochaetia bacterium]|nr:addiction module toxin RelE [Spirochaetia bacterium]